MFNGDSVFSCLMLNGLSIVVVSVLFDGRACDTVVEAAWLSKQLSKHANFFPLSCQCKLYFVSGHMSLYGRLSDGFPMIRALPNVLRLKYCNTLLCDITDLSSCSLKSIQTMATLLSQVSGGLSM